MKKQNKIMMGLALIMALACVPFFTACETVSDVVEENQILARAVIEFATIEYIETGDTREERLDNAASILEVLSPVWQALGDDGGDTIDILFVRQVAESAIDWDSLTPAQTVLVTALLDTAQAYAEKRLSETEVPLRSFVWRDVLGAVDSAATDYLMRHSMAHGGDDVLQTRHLNALAIVQSWED